MVGEVFGYFSVFFGKISLKSSGHTGQVLKWRFTWAQPLPKFFSVKKDVVGRFNRGDGEEPHQ